MGSQNYICHFTASKAYRARDVGGYRRGVEGSQDHDLVLRCTEKLESAQIVHIPRVLYHWRATPRSTALSRDAKDYAAYPGERAVDGNLQRFHPVARVPCFSPVNLRVSSARRHCGNMCAST